MTAIRCQHCDKMCGGPQGLSAHVRSMHPEVLRDREAPPEPATPAARPGGLVWEEPPPRGRTATVVPAILALVPELRANPGRWARLYTFKGATSAGGLKKKLIDRDDVADIEFSANKTGTGSALFGRYTGE